ncbi:hypothetical protein DMH02_009895 [Streptomyces sp. WAC 00631]|uniref:hypothetical protein n=1 Tax=Streptomyces sp. WAC 00631 TaxID=2203201 RepID=UPI001E515818|nr:hypothetical protein [Streptomyces sp. WAC 00631]MCC5033521.1 hypothetical protein [Streptomyces sp. WAC 00631]
MSLHALAAALLADDGTEPWTAGVGDRLEAAVAAMPAHARFGRPPPRPPTATPWPAPGGGSAPSPPGSARRCSPRWPPAPGSRPCSTW